MRFNDGAADGQSHTGCPYQKLRPTVLVVQATEDGHRNDPPDPVDRSMDWGVFVQRQVRPELVVIRDVGCDDAAEMSLAEHDEMVETVPSDRADQPFDVSVLPRRSRCRRPITDTHALAASGDGLTIDRVTIADQVARSVSPRKCIVDLSCDPRRCRMRGDTER